MKKLSISINRLESDLGWFYMALQLLVLPKLLQAVNGLLPEPLTNTSMNFVFFSLNSICIAVIFHRFLAKSLSKALRSPGRILKIAIAGVALDFAASLIVIILIFLYRPEFVNANNQAIAEMTQENWILMSLGVVLLAPVAEETLFRGLVFRPLYNRSPWMGYLVSSLVFASIHVVGYINKYDAVTLLLCFIQYIPPSLCLGWAYAKTDTICTPILMHMIINAIGIFAMR